jgi:3-hydroxyisobutyrate dehydrogenase-like beta-hydroxyacid dehydrogenase
MKLTYPCFIIILATSVSNCKKKTVTDLENEMIEGIKKGDIIIDKPTKIDPKNVEELKKQIEANLQDFKSKDNINSK